MPIGLEMPFSDPEKHKAYHREYMRRYNQPATEQDREHLRAQWRAWHHNNKVRRQAYTKARIRRVRLETLSAYGGLQCACCKETEIEFLCLDHIHNNAAEERRVFGCADGFPLWSRLKKAGWPSGYQVLCYNCNNGKRVNGGVCPHQKGHE